MKPNFTIIIFFALILSVFCAIILKVFSKIFRNPEIDRNQKLLWTLVIIIMPFIGMLSALVFIKKKS